ncbi:MAG: helix-turn-helix domain-containing protein [Bacteroidota bacterium]
MNQLQKDVLALRAEVLDLKQLIESHTGKEPADKVYSAQQTMEFLGISRGTFNKLWKEGKLKVYQLNRRLYCKHSEIMETLENNLTRPAA